MGTGTVIAKQAAWPLTVADGLLGTGREDASADRDEISGGHASTATFDRNIFGVIVVSFISRLLSRRLVPRSVHRAAGASSWASVVTTDATGSAPRPAR